MATSLLAIEGLSLEFRARGGTVRVLEDVGFDIRPGELLGVVGESGSGKSVTAQALLRVLERTAVVTAGRATWDGIDLLACPESTMRDIRGRQIAMIFQNPRAALNPVLAVGRQIEDVLVYAGRVADRAAARTKALDLLDQVRIAEPARRYPALPMELSGGMCQRVMIAIALAAAPSLLIADEPTTGLDVTTQAVIMRLIAEAARARGMATLLITHDLALAGEHCDRMVVMHAGHVVEVGSTDQILGNPRHPYTRRLIASTPQGKRALDELLPIPGGLPDLRRPLPPCRYRDRCEQRQADCDAAPLPRRQVAAGHVVACRHPA